MQEAYKVILHIAVVATLALCILFTYTLDDGKVKYILINSFLALCMLVGISHQAVCLYKMSEPMFVQFGEHGHGHSTTHLMVGIYIFGIGTLFANLLPLHAYFREYERILPCNFHNISQTTAQAEIQNGTSSNSTHAKPPVSFGGVCYLDLVLDVFRLVFTLLQLYFIHTFRKVTHTRSRLLQATLYITIIANFYTWAQYLAKEMHFGKHDEYNSSLDQFTTRAFHMEEIMIPFIIEYCLLATGLLCLMSFQMWDFGPMWCPRYCPPIRCDIPMDSRDTSAREENLPIASLLERDDVPIRHSNRHHEHQARSLPGLICGTFCGLLLLVSSLMFNDKQNKFNKRSHSFFLVYEGCLALGHVYAICVILKEFKYQKSCGCTARIQRFLISIGFLGTFAFHVIASISVISVLIQGSEHELIAVLSLWQLFMLLLSQTLQFILLMLAKSQCCSLTGYQKSTAQRIRSLTLFLLTTNVAFWALDSFIEIKDSAISSYPSGKKTFGQKWYYITSICYPFAIFYRFYSAEKLYEFWSELKKEEHPRHLRLKSATCSE